MGNKPYKPDGAQATGEFAELVKAKVTEATAGRLAALEYDGLNIFENLDEAFERAVANGDIKWVGGENDPYEADENFIQAEMQEAVHIVDELFDVNRIKLQNTKIVISPLFGVSRYILEKILKRRGLRDDQIIWVQDTPDGTFQGNGVDAVAGGKPNPETPTAREYALKVAAENDAELVLWSDPDADRPAVAVKTEDGYVSFNGNEQLAILTDYLLREIGFAATDLNIERNNSALAWQAHRILTSINRVMMASTVVSGDLMKVIARNAGTKVVETLTGFKYIGDQVEKRAKVVQKAAGITEREWRELSKEEKIELSLEHSEFFMFGGEESLGSLSSDGPHDKDAISGLMWFVEIHGRLKQQGITMADRLKEIYETYGYFKEGFPMLTKGTEYAEVSFSEAEAMDIIKADEGPSILNRFRRGPPSEIAGKKVIAVLDYQAQEARNTNGDLLFNADSNAGLLTSRTANLPKEFKKQLREIPIPTGNETLHKHRTHSLRGIYSFAHQGVRESKKTEKLPKENFMALLLEDGSKVIVRPSGTEPVVKFYINARGLYENKDEVDQWILDAQKDLIAIADQVAKERFPDRYRSELREEVTLSELNQTVKTVVLSAIGGKRGNVLMKFYIDNIMVAGADGVTFKDGQQDPQFDEKLTQALADIQKRLANDENKGPFKVGLSQSWGVIHISTKRSELRKLASVDPRTLPAWDALKKDYARLRDLHLRDFLQDSARAAAMTATFQTGGENPEEIFFDYSKNRIDQAAFSNLMRLGVGTELDWAIDQMFNGERINETENRSVLHVALRTPRDKQIGTPSDEDVIPRVHAVLDKMRQFSEGINDGSWLGQTGKPIKHIVNIGIGGSDLGPRMSAQALAPFATGKTQVHFVSNIDGTDIKQVLDQVNLEETLFIIASKTFTTQETMRNAETAKQAVLNAFGGDQEAIKKHFVALSTNEEKVTEFGIDPKNMFEFWDWVGGRYSQWSAIGLSLAIYLGFDNFQEFLAGAHDMDEHFRTAPWTENIPVIMAFLSIWHTNFFGFKDRAVLPYSKLAGLLPMYQQQLFMESNGKGTDRAGNIIDYPVSPILLWCIGHGWTAFFLPSISPRCYDCSC